jgi:hypothetical protein
VLALLISGSLAAGLRHHDPRGLQSLYLPRMKRIIFLAALAACGKAKDDMPPTPGSAMAMGSGSDMGSSMMGSGVKKGDPMPPVGSGMPDAAAPPPKVATADERAKIYDACWSYFNDAKFDEFKACFTADGVNTVAGFPGESKPDQIVAGQKEFKAAFPDGVGLPQLVLVSGTTVIGVSLLTGTNKGALKLPTGDMPATNRKIGILMGQVIEGDDAGRAKSEADFFDNAEMLAQLQNKPGRPAADKLAMDKVVAIAKGDDKEKANLDAYKKLNEAWSKHDAKAFADGLADDVVWSEAAEPKDQTKKEVVTGSEQAWKSMTDLKLVPRQTWAAGDYVAAVESFEGTNDGPIPDMGITKPTGKKIAVPTLSIYKLDGGKVKAAWIFYQSLAMVMQLGVTPK